MRYTSSANYGYVPPPSSDPYRYARPAAPEQVYTPLQRNPSKRDAPLFSIKQDLKYNRYHTHHFSAEDAYPPHPRTFSEYHARYTERERDQKSRRKSSRKRKTAPAPPAAPTYYQPQKYSAASSNGSGRRGSYSTAPQPMESIFYLGTDHHPPMFRSKRSKNPYSPPPSPPPWYASGGGYSQKRNFDMNRPTSPPAFDQRGGNGRHRLRRVARFLFGQW